MKFFNVIVIQIEIIDREGAVEHVTGDGGDEIFAEIQFVKSFLVTKWLLWYCLYVVTPELEPGEAGQGLDGLQGEGSDLVVGEAERVDGGCEAVSRNLSDMVVIEVEPQESLERTEEVMRDVDDLVLTKEQCGQSGSEVEVITIC